MKMRASSSVVIFYDPEFFSEHNFWGNSFNVEEICGSCQILDFQALQGADMTTVNTLILPYGQWFPLGIYEKLKFLLGNGGDIIVLGGAPFEKPCIFESGKWKIDDPLQIGLWKEFFHSEWRNSLGLSFHNVVRKSQWHYDGFNLNVNEKFQKAFSGSKISWTCEAYLGKLFPLEVGRAADVMSTTPEESTAPSITDFVTIVEPLHSRDIKGRVLCAGIEAGKDWTVNDHRLFLESMLDSLEMDNFSRSSLGLRLSKTTIHQGGELCLELWNRKDNLQKTANLEIVNARGNIMAAFSAATGGERKLPVAGLESGAFTLLIKNGHDETIKYPFSILEADTGKLPDFKVSKRNGYSVIEKDGRAIPAEMYSFDPVDRHLDRVAADFASHGIKIINFLHPLMLSWKGENEYDWSSLDHMIGRILRRAPDALIFPRILLQTPPWWDEANPDEVKVYRSGRNYLENKKLATVGFHYGTQLPVYSKFNNGGLSPRIKQASYYSEKWRNDIAEGMKALAKHVKKQIWRNNFIGVFFGAGTCGEWGNFSEKASQDWEDMSNPALTAFRKWLMNKYPEPSERVKAWEHLKDFAQDDVKLPESKYLIETDFVHGLFSEPDKIFEDAKNIAPAEIENALPPTFARRHVSHCGFLKDPQQSADSIEYFSWNRESFPELLKEISREIRAAFSNKIIVGTFYGYLMQEYFIDLDDAAASLGFPFALSSPDSPDLYVAPHYYSYRELVSGDANVKTPTGSIRLSDKIYMDENDQRTILAERKNYLYYGGTPNDTMKEAVETCKRNFVARLSKNVGMWWYDLFGHGWYDHPQIMKAIEKTFDIFNHLINTPNPASFMDSDNRLNVIYGTDGYKYHCACSKFSQLNTHEHIQKHFNRNGSRWEAFLKEDMTKAPKAKAWLFLNTFNISGKECDWIHNNLKRDGNLLIWLYAPGIYRDGKMDLEYSSNLAGIKLDWDLDSYLSDIELENMRHPALESLMDDKITGFVTDLEHLPQNSNINRISPEIYVNNLDAVSLGRNPKNKRTTFAVRDFGDWKSAYVAAPIVPHKVMRSLLQWGGMTPHLDTPDAFYSDGDIIGISSGKEGKKILSFPSEFTVENLWNEEMLRSNNKKLSLNLGEGETFIGRVFKQ
ncbi:MAG: hypothetical protein A2020_07860 [Lentisphaerae bacterium GWF2_45_14]|nr:MAG: hypothetical protein A2020_07860 [Lentisphaerae bacterium GWF2_45_14]